MSGMFDKIVEVLPSLPNELPRIIKQEKSRDDSETDKVLEDADQIELVTEFDEEPVIVFHYSYTVKPVLSGHSKRTQKLVFSTDYSLMQVKSIAECSKGSILQYFGPSLSYHLSLRFLFCFLFVLLLYVPSQQLRSLRDGQFT